LTSLSGLDNIDAGSITDLGIRDNGSLSTCEVQSICDYLASPNGTIDIQNNAYGCNSRRQVEAACAVVSLDEISTGNTLSIYPNPTSTNITIETTTKGFLTILNLNGQELLKQEVTEPSTTIIVNTLPSGIYFLKVTSKRKVEVGKFIKH